MTPLEVAKKITSLGICFNIEVEPPDIKKVIEDHISNLQDKDETMSFLNLDEQDDVIQDITDSKDDESLGQSAKIITQQEKLMKYDGWRLSSVMPKKITKKIRQSMMSAFLSGKKRTLSITFDDIPYTNEAVVHTFNIEYIKDLNTIISENGSTILMINTTFSSTGILVPDYSKDIK